MNSATPNPLRRTPRRSRRFGLAACLLCAAPVFGLAEGPGAGGRVSIPASSPTSAVVEVDAAAAPAATDQTSDERQPHVWDSRDPERDPDWHEAFDFFKAHSPRKYAVYSAIGPGQKAVAKRRFGGKILEGFRELKKIKETDPGLWELQVKRAELEDQVFDAASRLRRAPEDQKSTVHNELRQKVAELVDNELEARRHRADRFEAIAKRIHENVERDAKRKDELVNRELSTYESTGKLGAFGPRRTPGERTKGEKGDKTGERSGETGE